MIIRGCQIAALSALLALLPLSAVSAACSENLFDLYQSALENDPRLQKAEAVLGAVREELAQAKAFLLPTLSTGASFAQEWADNVANGGGVEYHLTFNQPLYQREVSARIRQVDARIAKAEAEYEDARQELLLRISTAYFNVLALTDDMELIRAERLSVAGRLDQVRQRFKVGFSTIIDIHDVQARYDLVVALEIAADEELADGREILREITGRHHDRLATLVDETPLFAPNPAAVEPWLEIAMKINCRLAAVRYDSKAAKEEIARLQSHRFPTLNAVASYREGKRFSDYGVHSGGRTSIGVQIDVPLYKGGWIDSQVRQAEFLHIHAQKELEQVQRAIEREVRSAFAAVLTGIKRVKALRQASRSSQTALDATISGFDAGTRTALEVLDAQREFYRASRDYTRGRYDCFLATLRLKKAAGVLDDTDLRNITRWLR